MAEDVEARQDLNLSSRTIRKDLILSINTQSNFNAFNNEIKIISNVKEKFEELEKVLKDLKEENFPNAFAICVEVKSEEEDKIESIKAQIEGKFSKVLLLQINSKIFLRKQNENFKEIELNLSEEEIQKSLNDSKFSTEIFLNIQKGLRIIEWKFERVLKYEKETHKLFLNSINLRDDFCIRLLNLFELKFSQETQTEIFQAVLKSRNFDIFLAFFDAFEETKVKTEQFDELFKSQNFFLDAVKFENVEVAKFLLKLNLSLSILMESFKNERQFFKIFAELKKVQLDSSQSDSREFLNYSEEVLKNIQKLHENIKEENLEEVKEFVRNFPSFKLCCGSAESCALELAIDNQKFAIFSFLRANNFYTDKGNELEEKISKLSERQKQKIRNENLKYVQEIPNAFIGILLSKCKFDALSPVPPSDVQEMLTDLSQIDHLRPFLQIAAQADLKIIFDFATESVKNMVPGCNEHTMGLAFFNLGELYVGRDDDKCFRYGTFMHELTHMVLNLIYENDCLPYCEGDTEREREWIRIVDNEKENFETDPEDLEEIISLVFEYYKEGYQQRAELAVRPNDIMARYFDDPENVQELREFHAELFDYLQNFVMRDLQIPNIFRLIELNKKFEVIEKIQNSNLKLNNSTAMEILADTRKKLVLTSNVPKLALLKLFTDVKESSQNKLDVKVKNIFVNAEKLCAKSLNEEFFSLVESCEIQRIIFDLTNSQNAQNALKLLQKLPKGPQIILVCNEEISDKFQFNKVQRNFSFVDLNTENQARIRKTKIKFQGDTFEVTKFFDLTSDEIFPLLCKGEEISINSPKTLKGESYFIPRMIQSRQEELSVDEFWQKVQKEKTVIFSNIAGSGKTFLLKKVHEIFLEEFPEHWISFVSLLDHVDQLSINSEKSFEQKFVKILKMGKIEEKVFARKFEKGEFKILFDGFDEISPKCKSQTLKLFELFNAQSENQIWITTRTHLEQELESSLKVKSHKIKILPESDQIKFLCDFWKNSNEDRNFIEKCAQDLVQKISEFVKDHPNLIGIPIIIQSVAKLYVNKIDENFPNEIKNLKLSEVYGKIVEDALNVLASRFPQKWMKNAFRRSSILQALEFLTIVHYFDENFANSLGLSLNESDFPLEELCRSGLLTLDQNGKVKFNHETYGEFFLSTVIENILENFNELSDPQIKLLTKILTDEKLKVTKMFFNEIAADLKCKSIKLFKSEESLKLFDLVDVENFANIFYFLMKSNLPKFPKFEEKIEKKLEEALRKTSKIFEKLNVSENFFHKLMTKAKTDGSNNMENLIKKLKDDNLEKILMHQNEAGETILHKTVCNFEKFQKVLTSLKKDVDKNYQKKLIQLKNGNGQNVLMIATLKNEISLKILLEFVESLMNKEEIEKLLSEVDNKGNNVLHVAAAYAESKEIFEFLWLKIFKNVQSPKEFLMRKGIFDRNALQMASQNENCPEIFSSLFDFAKSFCQSKEERKNLILKKDAENENVLTFSASFATKPNLEFLVERVFEIFGIEETKEILKTTKGFKDGNLLSLATFNKSKCSIEFLWKVFEENLSQKEIFELLNEKDEDGNNVLHNAAAFAKSKENFEIIWLKIFESSKNDEEKLKNYLKLKGNWERNILILSIAQNNENFFFYIFENIFERFFTFKDFIYECDIYFGDNFLHYLARFGSVSMLEFAFKKLEEKLSAKKLKSFLMMRSENNQDNLLHCAAIDDPNLDSIKLLVAKIEEILGKNELKELLNQKDWDGSFSLHIAIQFNTSEIFEYFTKLYEENFTKIEIKKILEAQDFRSLANYNKKDIMVREKVENFYKKLCDAQE